MNLLKTKKQVLEAKQLSRRELRSLARGATLVPVALAERTPPKELAAILAGFGADVPALPTQFGLQSPEDHSWNDWLFPYV